MLLFDPVARPPIPLSSRGPARGLGISSGIRSENVAYSKGWLEKIRVEPAFIFSVLSDVRQIVRFISERLGTQLFSDTHPDGIAG